MPLFNLWNLPSRNAIQDPKGQGKCVAELKVEKEHLNRGGRLHGGLSSTLVDITTTCALMTHKDDKDDAIKAGVFESVVLFLEEAFFLHHQIKCLEIRDIDDKIIPTGDLWKRFCNLKELFIDSYVSYLYLKSKNWVIKPGIKFGGDFCEFNSSLPFILLNPKNFLVLYKQSPQLYHASFIVIISRDCNKSSLEYHTNERIAETTGKNLLFLEVFSPTGADVQPSEYLNNLEKFTVKEVSIQRHEMKNKVN